MEIKKLRVIGDTLEKLAYKTIPVGLVLTLGSVVFHAIADYKSNKKSK